VPVQHKRAEDLGKHGGAEGLAASLRTSLRTGLAHTDTDARDLERRRAEFGGNKFKEVKPRPFLRLLLDNLRDPTLILLMVAAAVRSSWAALLALQPSPWACGERAPQDACLLCRLAASAHACAAGPRPRARADA